jgi:shikimate dehydrogenase
MKRKLKLGLLGNGIGKTQSKKLHELIGELYNLDASYELMDLSEKKDVKIEEELARCQKEGFHGVNVTHPYKRDAFLHVNLMEGFPKGLTSVNTVVFQEDGLLADNTDYLGFCEAYSQKFGEAKAPKTLLLGAGGVGLAIAFGLYKLKAQELVIYDMNKELATSLVQTLQKNNFPARLLEGDVNEAMKQADFLINATPVGMFQYPGNPFPKEGFGGQKWAFDAVYTPVNTEFLIECEKHDITTLSGFQLFLHQGIEAFKRFSGLDIDAKKVEDAFLKKYPLANGN